MRLSPRGRSVAVRVLAVAGFLAVWHAAAVLHANPSFFPPPTAVAASLLAILGRPASYTHIGITAFRVAVSVMAAALIGTVLGILPRFSDTAEDVLQATIYPLFTAMPSIAWAFLITVWFGLSPISPVIILIAALLPLYFINVYEGVQELDDEMLELGRSFTSDRVRILRFIVLPFLYPYFLSALRIAIMAAWKIVILAEFFAATSGVGQQISIARDYYEVAAILAWTLIIILFIKASDIGLRFINRRTMREWQEAARY